MSPICHQFHKTSKRTLQNLWKFQNCRFYIFFNASLITSILSVSVSSRKISKIPGLSILLVSTAQRGLTVITQWIALFNHFVDSRLFSEKRFITTDQRWSARKSPIFIFHQFRWKSGEKTKSPLISKCYFRF